jgi:hypothetical protein
MEEMNALATLPVIETEICRVENPLAPWNLTLDFDPENLPRALKDELHRLMKAKEHYVSQLEANAIAQRAWVEKVMVWMRSSTEFGPEHCVDDPTWERYFAAIVLSDDPLLGANPLSNAREREPFEQRVLATELLMDKITKEKKKKLEERAKSLLCSCNPRDEVFFSEQTLRDCLEQEGLNSKKEVNRILGRDAGTYIKSSDYRQALWQKWQDRDEGAIQRQRFEKGEWGAMEATILDTFTAGVFAQMTASVRGREWNPHQSTTEELRRAFFTVVKTVADRGESLSDYYLDPRDEDDWKGISEFVKGLREAETVGWWDDYQMGKTPAQRWMKEVGLPLLYGTEAEWWVETPDVTEKDYRHKQRGSEDHDVFFREHYFESEFKELVKDNYQQKLNGVLSNA